MNPYYEHFKTVYGSGLAKNDDRPIGGVYRGILYQRGYGLGQYNYSDRHGLGFMDGLAGFARFILPSVKNGLKYLGSQAVETVANIAQDAIAGNDIKNSAKRRVREAAQDIFAKAPKAIMQAVSGDKSRGVKRRALSHKNAGKLVASARQPTKRPKKSQNIVGKGLLEQFPALQRLV